MKAKKFTQAKIQKIQRESISFPLFVANDNIIHSVIYVDDIGEDSPIGGKGIPENIIIMKEDILGNVTEAYYQLVQTEKAPTINEMTN